VTKGVARKGDGDRLLKKIVAAVADEDVAVHRETRESAK
jgi:hypothetical protein